MGTAQAQDKIAAVASFSILGDLVKNVGGDRVALTTLVGPGGDAHVYEPNPADAKAVADAKLVFVNGLGFEGWMSRLIEAAGSKAVLVTASSGVTPIVSAEERKSTPRTKSPPRTRRKRHHHGAEIPMPSSPSRTRKSMSAIFVTP